jgi:hypothetical protein
MEAKISKFRKCHRKQTISEKLETLNKNILLPWPSKISRIQYVSEEGFEPNPRLRKFLRYIMFSGDYLRAMETKWSFLMFPIFQKHFVFCDIF